MQGQKLDKLSNRFPICSITRPIIKIAFINRTVQAQLTQWGVESPTCQKKFLHNMETLQGDLKEFAPDCVFMNKGSTISYEIIRLAIKPYKSVYFLGDYRNPFPRWAYAYATLFDMVLFTWEDTKIWNSIREMGQKNIFCVHQGISPKVFKPLPDVMSKKFDVTFGGGYYGDNFSNAAERLKTIKFLNERYNLQVIGDGWPSYIPSIPRVNHHELNKIHNQSKVTVGIHNRIFGKYGVKYGTSNRLYQCMAIGVPHITQYSPEVSKLFDMGYMDWKTRDELAQKIDALLPDTELRHVIGKIQRHQIKKYHTTLHAWLRIEDKIRQCLEL